MSGKRRVNDFVIRFANVNGTGSASTNGLFAKSIFRSGVPVSAKNIFPSNIQGLPTWYEVRISDKGYLGRREGIDIMVAVNPQSFQEDLQRILPGGYIIYDNSRPLHDDQKRSDINMIGLPMMLLSMEYFELPRLQQLFKNVIYLGALVALLDIDINIVKHLIEELFATKPKLWPPNFKALEVGYNYAKENYDCPLDTRIEKRDLIGDQIMVEGNEATALGIVYGGATVCAWYPITPSTSVAKAYDKYANKFLIDKDSKKKKFAMVQAEDELAAIGMVIGAGWNGARAFTSTSGAGVSLMNEFIGLAYFAEIPVFLVNVQRGGPSTGMPTRTQQGDIISSAYASHGDTKHILLFPSTPNECFEMSATGLDLADRFQTPIILLSDLDLGMNEHITEPFSWDKNRKYDRGKVLTAEDLDDPNLDWGRYLDIDGDGIPYRTIPGTHPSKGGYFTRGTSRDEYARYTEKGAVYKRNVDRLTRKWNTARKWVPKPEFYQDGYKSNHGLLFFGTTTYAAIEAMDKLQASSSPMDAMRIRAFPFNNEVEDFISQHDEIFVIEQNKDAQMRSLLINELEIHPKKLISILNYDGYPITAQNIIEQIGEHLSIKMISQV
ncbi:MAG: 2-oxoacid:acceptor oxidoreductase subunit alpha [Bacteroidia bacterium]|nr:2-oxoacid:acceptor oxidoreductase subunit alpha [Bacteroidia bacterium]